MLFGTASEIMNKLQTAETLLTDTTTKPSGDLRITAPVGLGTVWVTQRLREFMELYPDIRIELVLNDDQIAIAMRAADVAIWTSEPRAGRSHPPAAVHHEVHAFASTQYIRRHGAPQTLAALDEHTDHFLQRHAGAAPVRHPLARDGRPRWHARRASRRSRQQRRRHEVCDPRRHRHRPDS